MDWSKVSKEHIDKYSVIDAIWIATAILAAEKYYSNPEVTREDMFFKQSDIVRKARTLVKAKVDQARVSWWANADNEKSTHNYLRADQLGNSSTRRLSMMDEFSNKTYPVELNGQEEVEVGGRILTIDELFDFVRDVYPEVMKKMEHVDIDYIGVLQYLANNQEIPYSNPEAKDLPEDEKNRLLAIRQSGQNVIAEMKKIADRCKILFDLDKCLPGSWLDGSNTKTRRYLWTQMKDRALEKNPISISLFVEKENNAVRYRVSLEIKNDGVDKKIMERYHSHLELPAKPEMIYVSGSNEWGNPSVIDDSKENIVERVKNGDLRKVQICIYVENAEGKTNEDFDQEIMKAVEKLLPYYKYVTSETRQEIEMCEFDKNMILYGPPGTGKTYHTAIYAVAICTKKSLEEVRAADYNVVMAEYEKLKQSGRVAFTTFHQSYGYEEFIEGIKPVVDQTDQEVGYIIEPGVFKKFCKNARSTRESKIDVQNEKGMDYADYDDNVDNVKNDKNVENVENVEKFESTKNAENQEPYVFIIDEINRGNISKIFGELITLIEETKREGLDEATSAILPYSGEAFSVPSNVYILGTMNTADRSIALMDTALRRRFHFIEMMPDTKILRQIGADKVGDLDVTKMLETINKRITFLYDREHTIGHAFFTKLANHASIDVLRSIFEKSLIPLLQEYFYEDYQKIQLVLGDNAKTEDHLKFILDEKVNIRSIFKGDVGDSIDLPEKKYSINKEAFNDIEAYKQIM